MIADAGFRWIRMDFVWEATERERGRYDFSSYDRLMKSLDEYNLRALFILDYGNPLYTEGKSVRTAEAREAFVRWAVAAAKHFSNRGIIWEVFNEPNVPLFWPPKPAADEYKALALAVGRAFHVSAPNEKLIGPASLKIDLPFIEACFEGATINWSAVSVHPYRPNNPESAAGEYAQLRALIDKYTAGRSQVPIISGEWGYSSAWRGMDEEQQANRLARQFLTNAANGIPLSIWYDWRDDGNDPREPEHHFGLVRYEYRSGQPIVYEPKPAYLAAKTLLQNFAGYRFERRLIVGGDDDYVLVFEQNGQSRIAAWTTTTTDHQVTIPITGSQYSLTSVTGEDRGQVSVSEGALLIKLTSAPVYLSRIK